MTDVDWDLLFRYQGGECTADERARFEGWLASDPAHRALLDAAVIAGGRVLERSPIATPVPRPLVPDRRAATRLRTWPLAAAASLVIAVGGSLVWRAVGVDRTGAAVAGESSVKATGRGERATLRLPDGTQVVLGAASTLRYPADFGGGARDVHLTGEGYFDVVHDDRRPFRVHAGSAIAEDLGTAFSVRAYAEDSVVRVVVTEGLVALGAATGGRVRGPVLTPGQLGSLAAGSDVPTVETVDVEAYLGWMKGELVFDETPVPEVLIELARWYDAELRIGDSTVAGRRLTGRFTEQSLDDALSVIGPALDVGFDRSGDTVVVRARQRRR